MGGPDSEGALNVIAQNEEINPLECVRTVVSQWDGVTVHEHAYGGVEFRVGRREIGHLHPRFADLPFTRRVRDELVQAGEARPHHVAPESGWVTVPMRSGVEAAHVIALLRRNYERVPAPIAAVELDG